jgi:hypothetical protein
MQVTSTRSGAKLARPLHQARLGQRQRLAEEGARQQRRGLGDALVPDGADGLAEAASTAKGSKTSTS